MPSVLAELAGLMLRCAEPDAPEGERANALRMSAGLLAMAAERWDGAAEHLVRENRALAALLNDTAAEHDLRLSVLGAENARLRGLLIAAHVAAEQAGDTARLEAIWAELIASTERRKLSNAPV
ncbi:MAG: hypothetical protein ACJ798_02640 [Phenylobacterium sp.]